MPLSAFRGPATLALVALLCLAAPNFAAPPAAAQESEETPGELAIDGVERLLRAMELIIEMIPQYEAPELLPNGDIIIRRRNPTAPEEDDEPEDEFDQTGI